MENQQIDTKINQNEFYLMIDDFLKNKENIKNKTIRLYWDYDDKIPDDIASKTLNNLFFTIKETDKNDFKNLYVDNLLEEFEYFYDEISSNIDYLSLQAFNYLKSLGWHNFEKEEISEYINDNYHIDYNLEDLIKNTNVNLTFDIASKSWDDTYFDFEIFQSFNSYNVERIGCLNHQNLLNTDDLNLDINELKNLLDLHPMLWLIQSQGYTISDFYNQEKLSSSLFLKSLYEEINHYSTILSGMRLTFGITNINLYDVISCPYQNIVISKDTDCGLFNSIAGNGTGFNIELEKDITMPFNLIYNYKLDNENEYSLKQVYGANFKGSIKPTDQKIAQFPTINYKDLLNQINIYKINQKENELEI